MAAPGVVQKLGINRDNQKKQNRGMVLQLVATRQCTSRVELARAMGLTKTAISQIVNSLIEQDLLVETRREGENGVGRTPVGLDISSKAPKFIGLTVQREYCQAVLCDMQLHTIKTEQIYRDWGDREELIRCIFRLVDHMMDEEEKIGAIGASSIGPVSLQDGYIKKPLYFNGIGDIPIRDLLSERYHLPVYFDHDNQSAAKAEFLYGSGRGFQDILLVTVGRGVGCGVLIGGSRTHSFTGYNPEIGHISIDYRGRKCVCGNTGCLEMYVASGEVLKKFRTRTGLDLSYRQFCSSTDPECKAVMEETLEQLASGILNVLCMLNSQLVILGGDCNDWPDCYILELEEMINRRKFGNREITIHVRKSYYKERMQILGAACNAIDPAFKGEIFGAAGQA